ncbi:unnamed protein product [Sphacelaria rigidula]
MMGSPATSAMFSSVLATHSSISPLPSSKILFNRTYSADLLSSLCQEVTNLSAPSRTPACHGVPPFLFRAEGQRAISTPRVCRLSSVKPFVAPKA